MNIKTTWDFPPPAAPDRYQPLSCQAVVFKENSNTTIRNKNKKRAMCVFIKNQNRKTNPFQVPNQNMSQWKKNNQKPTIIAMWPLIPIDCRLVRNQNCETSVDLGNDGMNWRWRGVQEITLPETNGLHLTMDSWNTCFFFGRPIFKGELLL